MDVKGQAELDNLLSGASGLVIVHFFAATDGDSSSLEELSARFAHVTFGRVDVESADDLAKSATATPTFVLFKEKEVVESIEGNDPATLTAAINKHTPEPEPRSSGAHEPPETPLESSANEPVKTKDMEGEDVEDEPVQDVAPTTNSPEPSPPVVLSTKVLDSMWNSDALSNADSSALPPPRHFDDTLSELRMTFFPKAQHKAVYVVDGALLVEPTLALYCPIEGGEYVIDATVKELALKTGADVQVVDMAHVAAGEWGNFGKLASGFRFRNNPLGKVRPNEDTSDDDDDDKNKEALESFWRALIASNPTPTPNGEEPSSLESISGEEPSSTELASPTKRPRIIYIRDFALLSPRSHTWFPPLYSAIRARRTGGAGPDKPISNPTTVVFGVCPAISSIFPNAASGGGCQCSSCRPSAKGWDESATQARADRLKGLKEKWNNGTLLGDLPSFGPTVKIPNDKKDKDEANSKDNSKDSESTGDSGSSDNPTYEQKLDGYFCSCVVAPAKRNPELERAAREKRRRELNELMFRMMLGVKGGEIEGGVAPVAEEDGGLTKGWDERLLESDALKDVVDRALKMARLSSQEEHEQERVSVTWAQLEDAWRAKNTSDEERKAWTSDDDSEEKPDDQEKEKEEAKEEAEEEEEKPQVDEVIEKVKAADLDDHEKRLLGCIVDVVKIPTTFDNVHLPTEVIDSVRSIVSLPLLFPDAFKTGILKQQAISGALLFGPPGTGKTLVVRALAKESGARMIAIKPSDVSDMWVGETEKLVKSLFKLARRLKPCVVFIDEIDSLMGCRQNRAGDGGSRWHTSMLTEFMQEMDGLMASSVMVIGATNRPFDIDDAVLRRLPCRLLIDLPGERAREEILKIMLRDDELGPDVSISDLAKKTDRFSGSDLKHLCVAAAMSALKESVKLPWATKKEESKDAPSANGTPVAGASEPKPAANATTEPEKDRAKSPSSNESDDASSFYSSSNPAPDSQSTTPSDTTPDEGPSKPEPEMPKPRILEARHFFRALMDITPSSSESRGSLTELRKWNAQFGTGGRDKPQRPTGSLPYSYGGEAAATGLGGVPGVNGLSGIGSNGLGPTGLRAGGLGSPGLAATGLGAPGPAPGASRLNAFLSGASYPPATAGPSYGATGAGYTPPTYTPPTIGGPFIGTGYTPKFPVSTRNTPGYNPSPLGNSPSVPGL